MSCALDIDRVNRDRRNDIQNRLNLSTEVSAAIRSRGAIVALESTIIAHGMPYPQNAKTAREVEAVVREAGAVPATIAILDGVAKVGLTDQELDTLGRDGRDVRKVSMRDIAHAIARKENGATTVAATMRLAAMAGIAVFATGGIGGVHRGAETNLDISADLTEIAQSNVAVVTAGAKAILDLPLTLERLETLGVPVIGYGTDEFPAFYSRESGCGVAMRCDTAAEVADVMHAKWSMGLNGGIVVANPIPAAEEIPAREISPVIEAALNRAEEQNIGGKDLTPFLLAEIARVTEGRSLAANIALIKNNARVAANIAVQYAKGTS